MSSFGDLFGQGPVPDPFGDLFKPKRPDLPCSHVYGSDGKCHYCKEPKPAQEKPKAKQQMRKKIVEGVAYIHADDVASILEVNKIQPALAEALRNLNKGE